MDQNSNDKNTTITSNNRTLADYFEVKDAEKKQAECSLCRGLFSYSNSSNLRKHLKRRHHDVVFLKPENDYQTVIIEHEDGNTKKRGKVWNYFTIKDKQLWLASCNLCENVFSYRSATSNLTKHLMRKHNDLFKNDSLQTKESDAESDPTDDADQTQDENHKDTISDDQNVSKVTIDNDHGYSIENNRVISEKENGNMKKRSKVWNYFKIKDKDLWLASCNLCEHVFSYRSSTSNLNKHLMRKHNDSFVNDSLQTKDSDAESNATDDVDPIQGETHKDTFSDDQNVSKVTIDNDHGYSIENNRYRSPVWNYFMRLPNKTARCLICRKKLSYLSCTSNLTKHIKSQHPKVNLDSDEKRLIISTDGQLYEIKTENQENEIEQCDVEMDPIYLDGYEDLEIPKIRESKKRKTTIRETDDSSDEETSMSNKRRGDSLDHFGAYLVSLLRQLPKDLSNGLQINFVKQIMALQQTEKESDVVINECIEEIAEKDLDQ